MEIYRHMKCIILNGVTPQGHPNYLIKYNSLTCVNSIKRNRVVERPD